MKVVVIKNNVLGQIKWEQMVFLGNPEFGCELQPIDFAGVARACGIQAFFIDDAEKCGETLRQALATPGPVLIEAVVDPNEPPLPPKVTVEQAKNFAESLLRGTPTCGRDRADCRHQTLCVKLFKDWRAFDRLRMRPSARADPHGELSNHVSSREAPCTIPERFACAFPRSAGGDGTLHGIRPPLYWLKLKRAEKQGPDTATRTPPPPRLSTVRSQRPSSVSMPSRFPLAHEAMLRRIRNIGRPGLVATAIAAVDSALWDLKGKLLDCRSCLFSEQRATLFPSTAAEASQRIPSAGWRNSSAAGPARACAG